MATQKLSMRACNGWNFVNFLEDPSEAVKMMLELMPSFEDRSIAKKLENTKISSRIILVDGNLKQGDFCRESCSPYSLKFVDLKKDYNGERHMSPYYFRNFPGLQIWNQNLYKFPNKIKRLILEDVCEVVNQISLTNFGKFKVVEFSDSDEKEDYSYRLYIDKNGPIISQDDLVTEVLARDAYESPFSVVFSTCGSCLDKSRMQDFWFAYSINFNHGANERCK
jgi:hypothetical protein